MSEDAPSWGALEGKTWGEISQRDRFLFDHDGEHVHVPVSEDIQKTLDDLRADVETLKARVDQLGRNLESHSHEHCWHDDRCCWCRNGRFTISTATTSPPSIQPAGCLAHPTDDHGQFPVIVLVDV